MTNLHRDLAPISAAAWAEIEEEASRTFKRHVAGRRVVDVEGPSGDDLAAIPLGHQVPINPLADGVIAHARQSQPIIELRVPFTVSRQAIDDVERALQAPVLGVIPQNVGHLISEAIDAFAIYLRDVRAVQPDSLDTHVGALRRFHAEVEIIRHADVAVARLGVLPRQHEHRESLIDQRPDQRVVRRESLLIEIEP